MATILLGALGVAGAALLGVIVAFLWSLGQPHELALPIDDLIALNKRRAP